MIDKKHTLTLILLQISLISFAQNDAQNNAHKSSNINKILVEEVLQTTSYTYLLGNENGNLQWFALPRIEAAIGEEYYYTGGFEMRGFKSTELDRVFDSIFFLQGIQSAKTMEQAKKSALALADPGIKIIVPEGGISISELLTNKNKYEGQSVKISGRVAKYNVGIMGKNWLHLQDDQPEKNDITVTTNEITTIGKVLVIEGKVVLNKNLGSGYFYEIIIEEAKILK
ncbi:MAG: hypothetical protein ABFS32_00045 [Bacteroidota bacterium]